MRRQEELLASLTPQAYGDYLSDLAGEASDAATPVLPDYGADVEVESAPLPPAFTTEKPSARAPATPAAPKGTPPDKDLVSSYLGKKFGFTGDLSDAALKDAESLAADRKYNARMGSAFATIGNALASPLRPVDREPYQELEADADTPEKNLLTRRKAAVENQKFGQEQMADDPNSPVSVATRRGYASVLSQTGLPDDVVNGMSASQIHSFIQHPIETMAKIKEMQEAARLRAEVARGNQGFRDQQLQERQDFRAHQTNLNALKHDKQLTESASRATNLSNAINNYDKLGVVTPQDLADLQALTISNMGVQGGGSVGERAERYAKSVGINSKAALQFLTGNPQDIGKDNPIYQRFGDIARMEIENFRNRAGQRVKALTSGNSSIYSRRPDLKSDLDDAVTGQLGQISGPSGGPRSPQAAGGAHPPGSMVQVRGKTYQVGPDGDSLLEVH